MLKKTFVCLMFLMLSACNIPGWEPNSEAIRMPEGFESIQIGMPLEQLLETRPNVKPFGIQPDDPAQKVDLAKEDQIVLEALKDHPLFSNVMYVFQDGRLHSILFLAEKDIRKIREERASLISSSINRWGSAFEKRVVKIKSGNIEYLAPLLLWDKGEIKIAVTSTPELMHSPPSQGIFQVNIFSQENLDISQYFREEKVSNEIRDELFKTIGISLDSNQNKGR